MRHARTTVSLRVLAGAWAAALAVAALPTSALADPPNGPALLRMLGPRAQTQLEPRSSTIGALVRVSGEAARGPASVGLAPYSPGFARLRGTADQLLAFAAAHPDLPLEVAPPPHLLLDKVGQWTDAIQARQAYGVDGTGTLVGIADTGIDFTLDDFNDPKTGLTRVAWLLDLSAPPAGIYPVLEAQYGGAVYAGSDLDALLGNGKLNPNDGPGLTDEVGHGSHVASIAAGNGGLAKQYVGIAPGAELVIARVTRDATSNIASADLLTGVQFLFDRAATMNRPIAVSLSIGSDFGPHDGTMAWEEALAAFVGPSYPGRALVVAAGNSGDITAEAVHESVFVPPGGTRKIPIACLYDGSSASQGQVQVWVTMHAGSNLSVGLESPTGTWIAPAAASQTGAYTVADPQLQAAVYNGASVSEGQIPGNSNSAIVLWEGTWSAGTYFVTLTGSGGADLYVEGSGDAIDYNGNGVGFVDPVREGTINIPGTNPGIIAVGCTVNRASWTSIAHGTVSVGYSRVDPRGGYALDSGLLLTPVPGDVCWFSSAGPTVTGVPKPEISAPGAMVIAAMSGWAPPKSDWSIFYDPACPPVTDGGVVDDRCMQVDATHAVGVGTSMSAPQAAGAAALLFQKDPTLTQDKIMGLLQAGAHPFRTGTPPFEDQGGPGELDVQGSLDALDQVQDPAMALPCLAASWITLSADEVLADGSTPLTAIVELRTVGGAHRADFFDATRLAPVVLLDGAPFSPPPPLARRAPGVWVLTLMPPAGLGGHTLTLGATFDGSPIVTPKSIPIATEVWTASYPSTSGGSGCDLAAVELPLTRASAWWGWGSPLLALGVCVRRRRRRARIGAHSPASETVQPWGSHR